MNSTAEPNGALRRLIRTWAVDGLEIASFLGIVVVALLWVNGGTVVHFGPVSLSLLTMKRPIIVALALAAARIAVPGVGVTGRLLRRFSNALAGVTPRTAVLVLGALMVLSLVIKLHSAWFEAGFFSGDDVEIHDITLSALLGAKLPVWNIRSPVYSMGFIYPIQALALGLGVQSIGNLVFAGRLVVVVFSLVEIWLIFDVGRRLSGIPVGLTAAFLLATNQLHNQFGSSELPRTASAVFVLLAFRVCLEGQRLTDLAVVAAGFWLALAHSLRFSEGIFMAPAVIDLLLRRRFRLAILATVSFVVALLLIQGVSNQLYWHQPFVSMKNFFQYTILERQSSRGFQPWNEYLRDVNDWSTPGVVALALWGLTSRYAGLKLWTWIPVVLLSFLPHKEPRYLLPSLPFICLSAAGSWEQFCAHILGPGSRFIPGLKAVATAGILGGLLAEVPAFEFSKYDAWVPAARFLEAQKPLSGVAIEDFADYGGERLYLWRSQKLVLMDWSKIGDPQTLRAQAADPDIDWITLRPDVAGPLHYDELLSSLGFREVRYPGSTPGSFRLFARRWQHLERGSAQGT